MSNKNPRLNRQDVYAAIYPVGTDQYVRLLHTPTQLAVGKELRGKDPARVKSDLMRILQSRVADYEKEQQRKILRTS